MGTILEKIVAEVSKTWVKGATKFPNDPSILASRFEEVIRHNRDRGYILDDWRFSQVTIPSFGNDPPELIETIIAVFVKTE